jgi:hypothetical protein
MEYTRQQLAESVKNKYPQYAAIDNDQLADSILKKYPQYRTNLDDGGILDTAKKATQVALAGFSDFGYATLEGVASGISRLTGDSDLVKTVSDFRNYSKDFYEGSVPDEDKSKFGFKAVRTIAQTPGFIAAAAAGPLGLPVLLANAYQQGRDDYLSTQGVTSFDASEDQLKEADKVGAFSAVPILALERIGASKLVNNIFKGKSTVTIREAGKRITSSAVGEGLTEGSQTIFQNTLASELMQYDPDRKITEDVFESILLGAVAGGTVTSPVVGYQAFQDRNLSPDEQVVEQGVDPDTELTYTISYVNPKNDEQSILNIQAANPEEAVRLATQGLGNRAVNIKYEGINISDFKAKEEVTAEAAPVTIEPGSVKLTQKETEFFNELLENEANRAELLEEVPSLNIVDEKLSIEPTDIQNLNNFISDISISDGLGTVPPRLKTNKFYEPFFKEKPEVTAGAAPVQTIDFIKGASGDPAQNLASRKRRRAGTGEGKNPSLRLEVNGKPIYIGKDSERGGKSFEGWAEETSAWFTDQEINNAAGWYDSLKSKFTKEFGPERGPKMMLAWLASQQNESPAGGVRNTFRVIDRLTGIKSGKKGGLADEKLEAIFTDTLADKGLDAKLSDFIDAGMGKRTRTFMGDDADGGMPFVADVHTGRDSGKLDQQTLTRIKRFADNGVLTVNGQPASVDITEVKEKKVKGKTKTEPEKAVLRVGGQEVELVRDLTGSPSKGEYEGISDWGNRLTDYLNSIGWKGRTDWIPAEVQAVGWMRTLRQYGLKESDLESSLIENTFRVAAEVDYGLGSKITQIYPDFQKLNEQQKTVITEDVLGFIVPRVQQEMAPSAILRDSEFGIGSWEGSVSPSGNFYVMGSDEAANIFTNSLAWVTEQAGTMQAVIGKGGKNQRAVALVGLSNNELSSFVDFVNQIQTGTDKKAAKEAEALRGFSTRAMPGEQGIIVFGLTESKAKGVENTLQKFADQYTGADSLTIRNFSAVTKFTENNWKDNQNGESYIREIEQSGSTGNIRERLLRLREQYGQRLAETGQRVAPEVFGGTSIQSRVDQFVEAGKEYLEGTGTDVIAEAAPTDETAQVAPTDPGGTFNQNTLDQFITKNFLPLSRKIGSDIVPNYTVPLAQYNATQGVIEYNPAALARQDQKYITAAMREEIIHAAMSKVILQKTKGKNEGEAFQSFMASLGQSLTPEQRTAISEVYSGLETDAQFGAEYSRAAIQQALYGDITESYIRKGPAFEKLKSLLKSVQSYLARTLGAEVKANPEAAGVIRASAELLQQVDPSAKLINQTIVKEATAQSAPVFPNSNYGFAVQGEPFNERKIEVTAFDKYAKTMNALLADIDPALKSFSNQYYYNIESKSLDRLRAALPFVEKYRGIKKKSKRDFQRLKRLLLFSEVSVSERGQNFIKERDALLKKYGMYNDFQLGPRFILDEILDEGTKAGVEMGKVYDYMPRFINDLDKVKNYYGKSAKTGFREYIKGTKDSEGNVIIKGQNQEIRDARARLDELQEQGQPVPESVRELANKEIIPVLGGKETAYYEAIYFDDYLRQEGFKKPKGATPSSTKERTVGVLEGDLIPSKIIDAYDDIDVALERYIYNMTSSLETLRIIGRRYTYEDTGIKINKNEVPSDLSVLLRELVAANRITEEQASGIIPDIFQRAVRVRKQEAAPLELLRSLGYISGLVEFTSTLSQLLDTSFVMVRNNPIGTLAAVLRTDVKGQMVDIDVEQIASEFVQDKTARTDGSKLAKAANFSNKALRKLLMTTGFRQLDMRMKNANLTANFNRYRKLTKEYYRDRNSKKSKLFVSELSYLGLSPNQQIQFMAELKRFKPGKPDAEQFRNAPIVRQVLFSRINESQPMSKGSRPLAATENPNAQILYMMKSFMVNQMNSVRSEIIQRIANPRLSALERRRALSDLFMLLFALAGVGVPVAGLKDFVAGRLGYLNDYILNALLSPLGISTYTGYKIKREGIFGAAVSYFAPVSLQMSGDMLFIMQKLANGQKVQPKDITAFGPYSEIINRAFGFNTESQLRKYKRKKKVGQEPIVIPPDIRVPQSLF